MDQCIASTDENVPLIKTVTHAPTATKLSHGNLSTALKNNLTLVLHGWNNNPPTGENIIGDPKYLCQDSTLSLDINGNTQPSKSKADQDFIKHSISGE